MEWIRVSAKTVADAVTEASIELGTSSDNIEYHVIEEGSAGFLGLFGAKKAVIEAKKKKTDEDLMKEVFGSLDEPPKKEPKKAPKKEAKKEPRKETKELKEPKDQKEPGESGKEETVEAKEALETKKEPREAKKGGHDGKKEPKEGRPEPRKEAKQPKGPEEAAADGKPEEKESGRPERRNAPKERQRGSRRGGKRQGGDYNKKLAEAAAAAEPAVFAAEDGKEDPAYVREEKPARPPREPADPEEAKRRAEKFLSDLFGAMGMDVSMEMAFEEDSLSVNIAGDEMGILIGKRGQTLDSLQYLTSLVVNKGNASYVRVKLDTEDYRNRRKATLENLAKNIAVKVKKTRRPVFLEPMNPYERRIIHSALQNDPYVTTHSEGDEPCRKVVVTLRKGNERYEKRRPSEGSRTE